MDLTHIWESARQVVAPSEAELRRTHTNLEKLAHDLNNALVSVHARVDVLEFKLPEQLRETMAGLRQALEGVNRILETSTHWQMPAAQGTSLSEAELRFNWNSTCRNLGITVDWQTNLDGWDHNIGPELSSTLAVLMRNSCDALVKQPQSLAKHIEVTCVASDGMQTIVVKDNGPGCGDLLAAVQGAARRSGGHMGLGLTTLAARLKDIGGELRVLSDDSGFTAIVRVNRTQR